MKYIIVPTDFSECANNALRIAVDLAKRVNLDIILCHVYQFYSNESFDIETISDIASEKEKKLQMDLNLLIEPYKTRNLNFRKEILLGKSIVKFLSASFMEKAELIVIGSHGASGIKEILLGSNAEQIIRKSNYPVLTIQSSIKEIQINKILFASNFLAEVYPAFKSLQEFISVFKPKLHLLKIITPEHFETSSYSNSIISDFIQDCHPENYTVEIANEYEVESGIIDHAHSSHSDVIAIATHGNTGISHLISGSIAENIANHSPLPVLSVKIKT